MREDQTVRIHLSIVSRSIHNALENPERLFHTEQCDVQDIAVQFLVGDSQWDAPSSVLSVSGRFTGIGAYNQVQERRTMARNQASQTSL